MTPSSSPPTLPFPFLSTTLFLHFRSGITLFWTRPVTHYSELISPYTLFAFTICSSTKSVLAFQTSSFEKEKKPGKRSDKALFAYCATYIQLEKKQYHTNTMVYKLSVVLVGALAVVAQASYGRRHVQQQHPKLYGNNQTSSAADTSSTVANSPETTSSAPLETFPTFTPDSSTPTYETPSSSAVPTIPLTTAPSGTSDSSPFPTGGNHTLTYTLGTGSSTTVVTTTILETSTKTRMNTVYATSSNDAGATGGAGGDNEPTTTITSTSTSTIIKTIKPTSSGVADNSGVVDNSPVGASSGSSNCPVPVTVTVTGSPVVSTSPSWI